MKQSASLIGNPPARRRAFRLFALALTLLTLALALPAGAAAIASHGAGVIPPPTISGVRPIAGPVGTVVTLSGSGFSGATVVELVHAEAVFTVLSDTQIRLIVPAGARSGRIGVTTPAGSAVSAAWFTVGPTLKSFTPASGPAGTLVTLTGINFTSTTRVAFNDVRATSVTVVSPAQITAVVPFAATTGPISVSSRAGSSFSADPFIVTAAPLITVTAPTGTGSYVRGSSLTVSWTIAPATAAGEFGLWARSPGGGLYIGKLVPASGAASYATSLTLDVPTGSGYQVIVAWRATAGSGAWTSFGTSPGSFAVTGSPAAKAITAFSFEGLTPPVSGAIDESAHTIALTVPVGTNVTALVATFTTTGAAVEVTSTPQVSGVTPNDFTSPVAYTVTAADASTQDYLVTVTPAPAGIKIGDHYGGGIVAYILLPGDPGYVAGQTHGLIAATADQTGESYGIPWATEAYRRYSVPEGTGTAFGTGLANTNAIIFQNGASTTYAAGLARAYNGGGSGDWYLPSRDELNKLYLNRAAIGGFDITLSPYYWSSSEYDSKAAWAQGFDDGRQYGGNAYKQGTARVRAVRAF